MRAYLRRAFEDLATAAPGNLEGTLESVGRLIMTYRTNTHRLFLLGAGFSKPAGLPLAAELVPQVRAVADEWLSVVTQGGFSHLNAALDRYETFLKETNPGRRFDLEEFGAWLDWEHILRLKGSDTFSDYGNEAGLQLRWAIGKVLYDRTPLEVPELYLEFASRLTTTDVVLTLNYDLLLERALDAVRLPFRRFPDRLSEIQDTYVSGDSHRSQELLLMKLHGSIDWTYAKKDVWGGLGGASGWLDAAPLTEGPRPSDDPLLQIAVIPNDRLMSYYNDRRSWYRHPALLLPPSTAKPLAGSPLVPLWNGVGLYSYMRGGFSVIGCSLPAGDPYVLQVVHHIATDYVSGRRRGGNLWPQRRMKLVDCRTSECERSALLDRYRFMDMEQTDVFTDGLTVDILDAVFDDIDDDNL